ncbi:hypothetical protein [Streptomyces sp. MP131-18]|uniref:hypothetical protein n=1 Tax=Streptomyces sp. MP131-18 TaxID=1857892 RepID=UPI00097CA7C5|nr:hypothetical protein [Streptomyces sp. MP131-18]ONK10372.1 hypothetical protein STBA_10940 [Streptomyces sp. MP131-18]
MSTLDQLVQAVRRQLMGYALTQEQVSEVTAPISETDIAFTVDAGDVRQVGRGVVEIDDELILARSYDASTGTVTVMGGVNGRGYAGTTPAAHAAGSLLTTAPAFPRSDVKFAINETITFMYPDLNVLETTEIVCSAAIWEYELPADAEGIWYVVGETIGPSRMWTPKPNVRYNGNADPGYFPSGKSAQLLDGNVPGRRYRIVYNKPPSPLVLGGQDFTDTGFPATAEEAVKWGACARLTPAYEAGRLQQRAVESAERGRIVGEQSALRTAAYYQGLFETALAKERRKQLEDLATYQTFQG